MLLDGQAEFLVIDLYDFQNDAAYYNNASFSTCAHEFFNKGAYKSYHEEIGVFNFMKTPTFMWYGYVDLFFQKIIDKYDSKNIILDRFFSVTRSLSHLKYRNK